MTFQLLRFCRHENPRLFVKEYPQPRSEMELPDGLRLPHRYDSQFCVVVRQLQATDIIWAKLGLECLISDRAYQLFQNEGLTGLRVEPAITKLMFPHDPSESKFWLMSVVGWGGMAKHACGIRQLPDPEGLNRLAYGECSCPDELFDRDQWDGSDFFFIWPMPEFWFLSPKAIDVLRKSKFKHYRLASLDKRDLQARADGVAFMPGRLRQYLGDERAREIGEPLSIY